MQINKIIEAAIYCDNVDEMSEFYQQIFGFEVAMNSSPRGIFLRAGESMLIIFNRSMTSQEDQMVPHHGVTGAQHFAFEIPDGEYDDWKKTLLDKGIEIEKEMSWSEEKNNGARSLYFRDPAGNSVELVEKKIWQENITI